MISCNSKQLIDEILAVHLYKGVQPKDLAEAIFEDEYTSLSAIKDSNYIYLDITYIVDGLHKHVMRYTYDREQTLLKIEQKIGRGRFTLQWDRYQVLSGLYAKVKQALINERFSALEIDRLISTLPEIDARSDDYLKIVKYQ